MLHQETVLLKIFMLRNLETVTLYYKLWNLLYNSTFCDKNYLFFLLLIFTYISHELNGYYYLFQLPINLFIHILFTSFLRSELLFSYNGRGYLSINTLLCDLCPLTI